MPYIKRQVGSSVCVYKAGPDGEPVGDPIGTHKTSNKADAQIASLSIDSEKHAPDNLMVTTSNASCAIKSLGDGRIGGYLVRWGDRSERDLQGEFFSPETDFGLDWYGNRPVLYHHGLDGTLKAESIGIMNSITPDSEGLWAEAQLNLRKKYVRKVLELVNKGILGWSSGTLPHLVESETDGHIKRWPIVEGSLTPAPAEPRGTDVVAMKSLTEASTIFDVSDLEEDGSSQSGSETASSSADEETVANIEVEIENEEIEENPNMSMQEMVGQFVDAVLQQLGRTLDDAKKKEIIDKIVADISAVEDGGGEGSDAGSTEADASKFLADEEARKTVAGAAAKAVLEATSPRSDKIASELIRASVKAHINPDAGKSKAGGGASPRAKTPDITVTGKYDDLSYEDMAYFATFMKGMAMRRGDRWIGTTEFYRELADKGMKAVGSGDGKRAHFSPTAVKAMTGLKANELDNSALASYGDEWVPDLWLSSVWKRSRIDNVVAAQFAQIDMPSNPYELPIESTDPTVYRVPETTDESQLTISGSGSPIPDSRLGTGKVTLTADKLALRVGWSTEVEEDSIIPWVTQARDQGQRAMLDAIDNVLLNGDSATSGNINYDGGTPGATDKFMVTFPGILKLPLVTDTTLGIDAGGAAPTLTMVRNLRRKLLNAYAARIPDLVYLCDFPTYMKLLNIPELLTIDKYGSKATVMTGEVGKIDNIPVLVSNEIALSASNGKVSSTGGNNTFGRLLLTSKPQFYIGYRRKVTVNVDYLSYYDAYQMTATVRPAFVRRDNQCASLLYDIAV